MAAKQVFTNISIKDGSLSVSPYRRKCNTEVSSGVVITELEDTELTESVSFNRKLILYKGSDGESFFYNVPCLSAECANSGVYFYVDGFRGLPVNRSRIKELHPLIVCNYGALGVNLDVVICNARDNRLSTFTIADSDRAAFTAWINANNIASEADTDFLQFQVGDALAKLASTSALKTETWSLKAANPECDSVVLPLTEDIGIFQSMKEQGFDFLRSRNIYIDLEKIAGLGGVSDIFAGFENLPIGIRYHLFFGNTQSPTKLNWDEKSIESNVDPSVYLDKNYPAAKCEFMRVTDSWTYADWEARTLSLAPTIDSGLNDEADTTALTDYMENNKLTYEETTNGIKADVASLLSSIVSKLK